MKRMTVRSALATGMFAGFLACASMGAACTAPADCPACPQCQTATCSGGTMFNEGTCGCTAVPDGTSCPDGLFCNGSETCEAGTCTPGTAPCTGFCDEDGDLCLTASCPVTPTAGCPTAQKSKLLVKNHTTNDKDKLLWTFINGPGSSPLDFANPQFWANYALCIYNGANVMVMGITVPSNPVKWATISDKGYKYLDKSLSEGGAQKVIVKSGGPGKTKAIFKGKGANLPSVVPAAQMAMPVRAQLLNFASGKCWEGRYSVATTSTTSVFKAQQ